MSTLDRAARLFGDVREGEVARAFTLLLSFFMLMAGYYVLKTVREPLVLATGGRELKAHAVMAQAGLLFVAVPLYGWLVARVARDRLIGYVFLFFFLCVQAFCLGAWLELPNLGFAFFVWVGVFNLAMPAQFGSFLNDIYTKEEGERLFPVAWIGASAGALVGSYWAGDLFKLLGVSLTLEASACLLLLHIALLRRVQKSAGGGERVLSRAPASFSLVMRSPYLLALAALLLLLNLVNTTGELVLSGMVSEQAQAAAQAAGLHGPEAERFAGAYIGDFYSSFFFWVNIIVLLVQSLLVSRLVKWVGFRGVLLALPIIAAGAYGLAAAGAGFAVFRVAKMAENSADYSIMNTARGMAWLPTRPDEKFAAKQTIDSFFVRFGDLLAGALVGVLALTVEQFAMMNLVVIVVWFMLALRIAARYEAAAPGES